MRRIKNDKITFLLNDVFVWILMFCIHVFTKTPSSDIDRFLSKMFNLVVELSIGLKGTKFPRQKIFEYKIKLGFFNRYIYL